MWEVRPIDEREAGMFRERLSRAFGRDTDPGDEAAAERFREVFGFDRTLAVFDEGDIVGTGAALSFDVTVPGGRVVPMAGTTIISVQPTHRRRGVLRAMMTHHLDDAAARGEPLAGLWASESSIYGRFGYGPATEENQIELDTAKVVLARESPGRVRLLDRAEAFPVIRSVYERVRPQVPGMLSRSDTWWMHRKMRDDDSDRQSRSGLRFAVYEESGSHQGYAIYRQKAEWSDFIPSGSITVVEIMAANPEAHRGLWRYLTDIDLFTKLEWANAPVDDPLLHEVTEPRQIRRSTIDALWIRLLDVPRALEARSYDLDGAVTVAVEDRFRPETTGTYRIEVEGGQARCARSDGDPEARCDVDVLGHLYLGGGNAVGMARAGRLEGTESAIRRLHRMFRTDTAPWCPEVF